MDSEDPLFILYTSGLQENQRDGTRMGAMVYTAYTFKNVFQYRPTMCVGVLQILVGSRASYIVYGPGQWATTVMFERTSYALIAFGVCTKHNITHFTQHQPPFVRWKNTLITC